jgi:hypothetical protein
MTRSPRRTELPLGYVQHNRPWRDTSRIREVLTREPGHPTLFARGVLARAKLAPVLQPFQPLLLSWSGREGARSSPRRSARKAARRCPGVLLAAFYLNELVMKLTTRHGPLPALFDHYHATLGALRRDSSRACISRSGCSSPRLQARSRQQSLSGVDPGAGLLPLPPSQGLVGAGHARQRTRGNPARAGSRGTREARALGDARRLLQPRSPRAWRGASSPARRGRAMLHQAAS